jgi:hypothetical protein
MRKILPMLIKIFGIIALIAVGLWIYSTCSGGPLIQRIDKTIPDISSVPYEITTRTNMYYAHQAYKNDDGSVTMLRWYERIDRSWILQSGSMTLPLVLNPQISKRLATE